MYFNARFAIADGGVLITDMQIAATKINDITFAQLQDDKGARWDLTPEASPASRTVSIHLTTPLALPISSGLKLVLKTANPQTVTINLIGRLVTM